ncbi:2OG-Fe(II) oxygenase [Sphingoaurantiacus capsulatus]|uniref:2OG-Fe(II) oxygenase n=1 Tax=Sphingoaurantiacus capsulatus TaxID=1771310 RepID=A0ABV7X785_9SPHN
MAGEIQRYDFVESLFYQDLAVSPELDSYVHGYRLDRIDHAETSFHHDADERLYRLTMACVDQFFISVGKLLKKSGMSVLKMWVQKYERGAYHPVHVHATDRDNYSFVFYIDCTEESAATMFYNVGFPYVDHGAFKVKPVKGRCVLFPGAMPHEALPNRDERRLIVSGNIAYTDLPPSA